MNRRINIVLVVAFAVVLLAPTMAKLFRFEPLGSLDEKRTLAKPPTETLWSWRGIRRLSAIAEAWERFFNDHFGLRKLMVASYRSISYDLLRTSPNPAVVTGRSDSEGQWLYLDAAVNKDGIGFESSLGFRPYSAAELQTIAAQLRSMAVIARERSVRLAVIVCPDKHTAYPDYLPPYLLPAPGTRSRLDQFWEVAAALKDVPLIDTRPILEQAKGKTRLYYRTDTHWNRQAGFLAYQSIAKVLAAQDPSRPLLSLEDIKWSPGPRRVGDLVMLMGVPSIPSEDDLQPELVHLPVKKGKVLLVGDSFSEYIKPFLEIQFAEVKSVLASASIHTVVTPALLDAEKPDIAIVESVERYWTMPQR